MKRRILILATIMVCAMTTSIPALAVTRDVKFVFISTKTNQTTEAGKKNDSEQKYYLTISDGSISDKNVFGTRIRCKKNDAMVSPYVLHKSKEQSKAYSYSATVNTLDSYYLKGKKDTSSTTIVPLTVEGKVTY